MLCVPLAGSAPLQPPDAMQALALLEVQLKVAAPPLATDPGDAVSVTVGTILTVTFAMALIPPGPLQASE